VPVDINNNTFETSQDVPIEHNSTNEKQIIILQQNKEKNNDQSTEPATILLDKTKINSFVNNSCNIFDNFVKFNLSFMDNLSDLKNVGDSILKSLDKKLVIKKRFHGEIGFPASPIIESTLDDYEESATTQKRMKI